MPEYLAPGVYIEEISTGSRPIEAVGTSIAGFIGRAPSANRYPHEPRWFDNWTQFLKDFVSSGDVSTPLSHGVHGFFLNGGTRCCVVNIGTDDSIAGDGTPHKGLGIFEQSDAISMVAAPGYADAASYELLLAHCEKMANRVAILDCPEGVNKVEKLKIVATAETTTPERRPRPRVAGAEGAAPEAAAPEAAGYKPRQSDRGFGALYFPGLKVRDPLPPNKTVNVHPSGFIAGIYARTDALRGVHKAPANEAIRGALDVTYPVTRQEQAQLNPEGVNCIRLFPREGIRVYGARTLAPSASEWRYLNVRRLFNMIEESIARSTRWVVFEPNDQSLWKSIRRDVGAFLTLIWRQGALLGRTPEEAFFVKCDEETNTQEEIDSGRVVTLIGIAPVKPAEFVVFRIGQGAGGAQVETP